MKPAYKIVLTDGTRLYADTREYLPSGWLRASVVVWDHVEIDDSNTMRQVRVGSQVREYPPHMIRELRLIGSAS